MAEEGAPFTPLVIDLSPFLQPPHVPPDDKAKAHTVTKLREAISGAGLFFLTGHGILIGEYFSGQAELTFYMPFCDHSDEDVHPCLFVRNHVDVLHRTHDSVVSLLPPG